MNELDESQEINIEELDEHVHAYCRGRGVIISAEARGCDRRGARLPPQGRDA